MAGIFRQSAIDKLSSPEQLDKALRITSPLSWLVLIGITVIIGVTLFWGVNGSLPTTLSVKGIIVEPDSTSALYCTETGDVRKVRVKKGDEIEPGHDIVDIKKRSSGDVFTLEATQSGTVADILVKYWDDVDVGDEVIRITPDIDESRIVVLYVPFSNIQKIKVGMKAQIYPTAFDRQKYGHMDAEVFRIEEAPATVGNLKYILGENNMMSQQFTKDGSIVAVLCKLVEDENTASGYYWSTENSNEVMIFDNTMVEAKFVVDESAPITKLLPEFVNN